MEDAILDEYKSYIKKCFDYLNGKINPINKPKIILISDKIYDSGDYGSTDSRKKVIVYINSILSHFEKRKYLIKTRIIMTISHELAHCCQTIDTDKYIEDEIYRAYIENQADYIAMEFLLLNLSDIIKELDKEFYVRYLIREFARLLRKPNVINISSEFNTKNI